MDNIVDIKLNFNDLEDVEIKLIELAHTLSVEDDQFIRTMGRCLKSIAPAWVAFIKGEQERNEENGPGVAVTATLKNYAFLSYMLISATGKPGMRMEECVEKLGELFRTFLCDFANTPQHKEVHYERSTEATVH